MDVIGNLCNWCRCGCQHFQPSYESVYQETHNAEFQRIRALVQNPNIGTFMHTDFAWACHVRVKGWRTDPITYAPTSVAYIPWARVADFVKGEETSRCSLQFVCQGLQQTKRANSSDLDGTTTPPYSGLFVTCTHIAILRVPMLHCFATLLPCYTWLTL